MLHTLYAIIDKTNPKLSYWGITGWTDDLSKARTFLTIGQAEDHVVEEELLDTRVEPIEID